MRPFRQHILLLSPLAGCLVFVVLYVVATFYYPGGSQFDMHSVRFSWSQNYWCNLLNEQAINGQVNEAKPIAIAAMLVLCVALSLFWYVFACYAPFGKIMKHVVQLAGLLSMASASLLFTGFHDVIVNIASFFGLIALAGTFVGLYQLKWRRLFVMGLMVLPLIAVNNLLYYGGGLYYLPVVQKVTFAYCLIWFGMVDVEIFTQSREVSQRAQRIRRVRKDRH